MEFRDRDVEQWMNRLRLPEDLRRYEMFVIFYIILLYKVIITIMFCLLVNMIITS